VGGDRQPGAHVPQIRSNLPMSAENHGSSSTAASQFCHEAHLAVNVCEGSAGGLNKLALRLMASGHALTLPLCRQEN
jgi:hypothetical protein